MDLLILSLNKRLGDTFSRHFEEVREEDKVTATDQQLTAYLNVFNKFNDITDELISFSGQWPAIQKEISLTGVVADPALWLHPERVR